jgi:hypothetical protein
LTGVSSVIDQQVHWPKLLLSPCHCPLHSLLIGHICCKRDGTSACPFDESHRFGQLVRRTGDHRNRRACLCQRLRYGPTNATTTAGNDGDLPSQINLLMYVIAVHSVLLSVCNDSVLV